MITVKGEEGHQAKKYDNDVGLLRSAECYAAQMGIDSGRVIVQRHGEPEHVFLISSSKKYTARTLPRSQWPEEFRG